MLSLHPSYNLLINFRQTFYPLFLSIILRLPRKDSSLEAVPFEGDDSPLKDIPFLKKRKKKKKRNKQRRKRITLDLVEERTE